MHRVAPRVLVDSMKYVRLNRNGEKTSVIYKAYSNGDDEFWDRNCEEIRWYKCTPTRFERDKARELMKKNVENGVIDMRQETEEP